MRGVISAANEADLYAKLSEANMELVDSSQLSVKRKASLFRSSHVTLRDLIQMFVQLNQLHKAGVPLLDALEDLRDSVSSLSLRDIIFDLHRDVSEGNELSEAMEAHPNVFTEIMVSLVSSGEETGNLSMAFEELIKYMKWTDDMRRKIKRATRYPLIVLFVVLAVITVLMGFVVPQIVGFLEAFDRELPWYTTSLIATSEFFKEFWWAVLAAPFALYVLIKILKSTSQSFALFHDKLVLGTPLVGPVLRKISIARFCQTLGAMFASGISILKAIASARDTVNNEILVRALRDVEEQMVQGSTLSQSLEASGEFPTLVTRMVKVGEETGNLKEILDQVTEFYNNDVDDDVQNMISAIEPSLTVVLGCMILWIAVAVFAPIYDSLGSIGI